MGDCGEFLKVKDPTEPASRSYTPVYLAPEWDEVVHSRWGGRTRWSWGPRTRACETGVERLRHGVLRPPRPQPTRHPRAFDASTACDDGPAWLSAAEAGDPLYTTMARQPGAMTLATRLLDREPAKRPPARMAFGGR